MLIISLLMLIDYYYAIATPGRRCFRQMLSPLFAATRTMPAVTLMIIDDVSALMPLR